MTTITEQLAAALRWQLERRDLAGLSEWMEWQEKTRKALARYDAAPREQAVVYCPACDLGGSRCGYHTRNPPLPPAPYVARQYATPTPSQSGTTWAEDRDEDDLDELRATPSQSAVQGERLLEAEGEIYAERDVEPEIRHEFRALTRPDDSQANPCEPTSKCDCSIQGCGLDNG